MAFSEFEIIKIEKELNEFLAQNRPSAHIRNEVDLAYRISGQTVEIFEIRPGFRNPKENVEIPIAKAKYIKTQKHWNVYWHMSDMKWHKYQPLPVVKTLKTFLQAVAEDKHACFFG